MAQDFKSYQVKITWRYKNGKIKDSLEFEARSDDMTKLVVQLRELYPDAFVQLDEI